MRFNRSREREFTDEVGPRSHEHGYEVCATFLVAAVYDRWLRKVGQASAYRRQQNGMTGRMPVLLRHTGQALGFVELLTMLKTRRSGFTIFCVAVLAAGLWLGSVAINRWARTPEIRKPDVLLSIKPQTVEDARLTCPIPLPDMASNVQFAVWSFGEVTQSWTRFEAPVTACLNHAEQMVEPFKDREGYRVYTNPIPEDTGVLCVLDPTEVDLSWFADCQSASGPVFRVTGGRAPVIWVDTDHGIFYCEVKNECHSLSPK